MSQEKPNAAKIKLFGEKPKIVHASLFMPNHGYCIDIPKTNIDENLEDNMPVLGSSP